MKLRISKAEFSKALGAVRAALGKGELSSHFLVSVQAGKATLSATNYELSVCADLVAEPLEPGAWCLPGEPVAKIFARLGDGAPVTISAAPGERILIEQERTSFDLAALPGESFPELNFELSAPWLLPASSLAAALRAAHCVSTDDWRPAIIGASFDCDGETLSVVATDGFRLGVWSASNAEIEAPRQSATVHRQALAVLAALAAAQSEPIAICMSGRAATFQFNRVTVQSRMVDANFVDWRRLPLAGGKIKLTVARDGLIAAVARVATIAERDLKTKGVVATLELDPFDGLTLTAKHSLFGTARTSIELHGYSYAKITIGLNPGFLLDALNALAGEHVTLALENELNPVVLTSDADAGCKQVLMPMRL